MGRRPNLVHAAAMRVDRLADNEHPKGTPLFILICLALIVGF